LNDCKTGGLSNVFHRYNVAGETFINKLYYLDNKIISKDTPNIMTHICGVDFNSLYPSVYSSIKSNLIEYTGGVMYMPGRVLNYYSSKTNQKFLRRLIEKGRFDPVPKFIFMATVKGYIPESRYNECINFPPIIRNINVNEKSRKLTQLLNTYGIGINETGYMTFTNYYLWYLIDRFGFVIEDVKELTTFTAHTGFRDFTETFMKRRIEAIKNRNEGKDKYCKMQLNSSYGKDGMNESKYSKNVLMTKTEALLKQISPGHISTKQITEDYYSIQLDTKSFHMKTPLQCAVWTLDNAKYWYLKLIYDFMFKAFDTDKIHFVEGDTDSSYWAISGNPNENCHQGFKYVIKDQKFYNDNVYRWFPNPNIEDKSLRKADEKKLLGVSVEKEGRKMFAIAPKCYFIETDRNNVSKLKGVSEGLNRYKESDFKEVLTENKVQKGINLGFYMKRVNNDFHMTRLQVYKDAITGKHDKMYCYTNHSCAPLINGYTDENYIIFQKQNEP
jgi:hypothetical protein